MSLRAGCLTLLTIASTAWAQSPVTLTVDATARGPAISPAFAGVSIFTGTQVRDHKGVPGNLFSPANTQLITLFRNAGIHHLRLGATGSPTSGSKNLSHADIDSLFGFAKAAGIKVIYSLHFADGPATAKYVWDNYRACMDCFAFDNEPDGRVNADDATPDRTHPNYFTSWRDFAKAVIAAAPGAKFAGPDAAGRSLVPRFVAAEKDSGCLALVTQHTYVGGNPRKKGIGTPQAIESMLSREWVTNNYPQLYRTLLKPVAAQGLPFRITELDDHVHGVTNASDAFVSALWALDVLHWWAAHGASGVNFQNTEWLRTDTFYKDSHGDYQVYPKAFGIRAFDLGSHGAAVSSALDNPQGLNLTAYAVVGPTNLFVTIINKEHGPTSRGAASVTINSNGFNPANGAAMFLTAPGGDVGATAGVTLGGDVITNDRPWNGKWTPLTPSHGQYVVLVPAASAAVVELSAR